MLTDTHCHFEDERYDDDREQVIATNLAELEFVVDVSEKIEDFDRVLALSEKENKVYASLGVHPHHALKVTPDAAREELEKRIGAQKLVAIGECGFDYYFQNQDLQARTEYEVKEAQRDLFSTQIDIALKNNLPLILHVRDGLIEKDAYVDAIELLKEKGAKEGTVHTFSSDLSIARQFTELGFYLGISGVITFDKTGKLAEVVKEIPLEKLVLETDAPYLTPVPHRGKRNEPKFTKFIAEKIAEIKNISVEEVLKATEENARKLFKIVAK